MPPRVLLLLPFAAALLSGCTSTQHHVFHGRVENLRGHTQAEQGTRPAHVLRLERDPASRSYMALQIDPEAALVIAFYEPVSASPFEIRSPDIEAWLLGSPLQPGDSLSNQIQTPSARPLTGRMKLNWKRPGIFSLTLNLGSPEEPPTIIRGKIKTERDWHLHY